MADPQQRAIPPAVVGLVRAALLGVIGAIVTVSTNPAADWGTWQWLAPLLAAAGPLLYGLVDQMFGQPPQTSVVAGRDVTHTQTVVAVEAKGDDTEDVRKAIEELQRQIQPQVAPPEPAPAPLPAKPQAKHDLGFYEKEVSGPEPAPLVKLPRSRPTYDSGAWEKPPTAPPRADVTSTFTPQEEAQLAPNPPPAWSPLVGGVAGPASEEPR